MFRVALTLITAAALLAPAPALACGMRHVPTVKLADLMEDVDEGEKAAPVAATPEKPAEAEAPKVEVKPAPAPTVKAPNT